MTIDKKKTLTEYLHSFFGFGRSFNAVLQNLAGLGTFISASFWWNHTFEL